MTTDGEQVEKLMQRVEALEDENRFLRMQIETLERYAQNRDDRIRRLIDGACDDIAD